MDSRTAHGPRARFTALRDDVMYTQPTKASVAPETCPFCNSVDVKTTTKEVNASTYWRCASCGQIWNASRLPHGSRRPSGRFN